MRVQVKTLLWLIPVSVLVSMIITMVTITLLTIGLGLAFDARTATILGLLIASACGAVITAILLTMYKK